MKHDPMLVTVTRGGHVESTHGIDCVVTDAKGALVDAYGETDKRIFPRSAIKALQAIPLVESGAADAFGFCDKHLALACASHNGEPEHVNCAQEMLALAGLEEKCLECGAQLPKRTEDQADLVRSETTVTAIYNNCSGKHAGFVAFAKHSDLPVSDYIKLNHPVQREIAAVLTATTHSRHDEENHGIDGCSIPTYKIPLSHLASAFARFGVGEDPGPERSKAMVRLRDACMNEPFMVAGTDRVCTKLMNAVPGRVFVKVGAEGVYTASIPELGYGIAMKSRDGNFRAVEVAVANLVEKYLTLNSAEIAALKPISQAVLTNWNGFNVGLVQVAE
ncbi:MAG: asparaginase [Rhizobiaceae bacterium]|nr:asparaginase [Rhizobiaceae bacterium]